MFICRGHFPLDYSGVHIACDDEISREISEDDVQLLYFKFKITGPAERGEVHTNVYDIADSNVGVILSGIDSQDPDRVPAPNLDGRRVRGVRGPRLCLFYLVLL